MKQKIKNTILHRLSVLCMGVLLSGTIIAQSWSLIPGITAQDISAGKNGTIWATGTNQAIYRWTGSAWETMPGGAVRIAVDPDGNAWVVNAGGQIYKYNSSIKNWELKQGAAKDIGIGADGSIWIIGAGKVAGGYEIYKWNGSGWNKIPGGALRIAVDPAGNAWVVNNTNNVFKYNGSAFELKPGGLKDIGVGANGTIWCTGTDDKIYQWNGSNWTQKTGGASCITVAPDGNAWVVNASGSVFKTTDAATGVTLRTLFTRGQTYEYRMLVALKVSPYANTISLNGSTSNFSGLDALGQALGSIGLLAAEVYAYPFANATAETVLSDMNNFAYIRQKVAGIMGLIIMDKLSRNETDAQSLALKKWATDLYYSIKVRSAKAILDEYQKWKADPCTYTADGYKAPPDCALGGLNFTQWYGSHSAPQDIIGKAGLKSVFSNSSDNIAIGTTIGLSAAMVAGSAAALATVLGSSTVVTTTSLGATVVTAVPNLCAAFGASSSTAAGGSAGAAIGATGWAGVVAAPVAAAILSVVVGTIEGFRVVEQAKVEPMLKMKLGAAMSEPINIVNMMADTNTKSMFYLAYQEAASKGFLVTPPKVDGEVRFYCQAGFVTSFRLSYTLNGQAVTKTTQDLSVGYEESFPIPYNATNITVKGWYALAGWKDLFTENLNRPTYMCYTSYGTVFQPSYKTDCPEVGNMTTAANQLTVTQGGGYIAWIKLTYTQDGKTVTALDDANLSAGWRKVYDIPASATNIRLQAWSKTGLLWEPWKSIIDKSWPTAPNECIKVYSTSLDPKWNNECK